MRRDSMKSMICLVLPLAFALLAIEAWAQIFRAKAYGQTGDLDRCLADIEEAIRLDPTNAVAVGARGDVHLARKDYQRALADYTSAAALDPNNALIFVGRGMAHVATHD